LVSEATGEIEKNEDNVLVIRRIHVIYHLKLDLAKREAAERAHGLHAKRCPVAQTIWDCVEITTSLELEELDAT
jgi:uncharacterized OsmC-like protein